MHRLPFTVALVFKRIRWIELLDKEVLLIDREDRESPCDVLVVSDGDSGQRRFACSNHIPSRSHEMHDIAQRRKRDHAMRVIGQNPLAGRGEFAGNRPVVAAHWRCGGRESNANVASYQALEEIWSKSRVVDTF